MNVLERARWARTLTNAGWLVLAAYLMLVIAQLRRAFAINQSSFEDGVWGQRAETVAHITLPQNLVVLVPAAMAAVAASLLVRGTEAGPVPWLRQLVRVVAGTSYVVIALALIGIVDVLAQAPDVLGGTDSVLIRSGGILIALAMIRACLECERGPER